MWPYQAIEPSACWTYTAFQLPPPKPQLSSGKPSDLKTIVPGAAATIRTSSASIQVQGNGQVKTSTPVWL